MFEGVEAISDYIAAFMLKTGELSNMDCTIVSQIP